jgi:hypothetical protein
MAVITLVLVGLEVWTHAALHRRPAQPAVINVRGS